MDTILVPVLLFAISMSITPGPNNMLLTASGATYGYRRTVPLICGIVAGIVSLLTLSALGLGTLFESVPLLRTILKIAGSVYLVYLAFRIAFSDAKTSGGASRERPLSFLEGAAFQYLNPKAYVMTITAMSVYPLSGSAYLPSAALIVAVFIAVTPISISLWAGFGTLLGTLMTSPRSARAVRLSLGALTLGSVVFVAV
ncbi:MAG: LysE family translocator [Alkalispirochaeta sp.]